MRKAIVLYKNQAAAEICHEDDGSFSFKYIDTWYNDNNKPAISLTLPKNQKEYKSDFLFPFFYNMLPEGTNKQVVCFHNRIDEDDDFGLLLLTAANDTIGAVTVERVENDSI